MSKELPLPCFLSVKTSSCGLLLENEHFPPFSNRTPRPHDAFFNSFFPPARKRNGDWKRYHLWWKLAHFLEPAIWSRLISCAAINWIQHGDAGEKCYWIAPYCIVFACVLTCDQTVSLLRLCSRLLLFGTRGEKSVIAGYLYIVLTYPEYCYVVLYNAEGTPIMAYTVRPHPFSGFRLKG